MSHARSDKAVMWFMVLFVVSAAISLAFIWFTDVTEAVAVVPLIVIAIARTILRFRAIPGGFARNDSRDLPAPDDPRYDRGPTAPQVAGETCVVCTQKMIGSFDGGFCKSCNAPIHKDCRKEHRARAHTTRGGAYR